MPHDDKGDIMPQIHKKPGRQKRTDLPLYQVVAQPTFRGETIQLVIPPMTHLPREMWKDRRVEKNELGELTFAQCDALDQPYGRSLRAAVLGLDVKSKMRIDGAPNVLLPHCF